jgi:diguanylate cyclase (GGDEF)-like protein/PAS domain S-box-containing protein
VAPDEPPFRAVLEALPVGVQIWEAVGRGPGDMVLRWANPAATAALQDDARWRSTVLDALLEQTPADFLAPYRDGRLAGSFRVQVRPLGGTTGLVSYENVAEEHERERALAGSERLSSSILASLQEGVLVIDTTGRITRANEAAATMVGAKLGEFVGASLGQLPIEVFRPDGSRFPKEEGPAARALAGEHVLGLLVQVRRRDGSTIWAEVEFRPLTEADGTPYGALGTYVDVTERTARERRMREEADSDPLTGLANRRALERTLEAAVDRAGRAGREVAVLMLDLDGFKALNDRWGHLTGDTALRTVAHRLRGAVRERDLVARPGGDEFVLVLPDLQPGGTAAVECAERVTAALDTPLRFDGGSASIRAALGLAVFPRDGGDPTALLAHADRAMYAGKVR